MKYQIVQRVEKQFVVTNPADVSAWAEVAGFKLTGYRKQNPSGIQLREELVGQPTFEGLCGPMYGGPGMVRYEDWETYNIMST